MRCLLDVQAEMSEYTVKEKGDRNLRCSSLGFPSGSVVKNRPAKQETQVQSWGRKIPWRRKWQPTPVFLPEKSHGQRSLAGYSPWGHKEWDTNWSLNNSSKFISGM